MALVSPKGRVLQMNSALRSLLGLGSYESTAERLFTDFVDADSVAALEAHLAQLNAAEVESFSVELRLRHGEATRSGRRCTAASSRRSRAPRRA
jgi:hypothetical protein